MFSEPEKIIEQLGLRPNDVVADFGAGSGVYTIAAAKALLGTGKVYAVDIQKELLTRVQNSLTEAKLGNAAVIWGNLEIFGGTKLKEDSVDVVILSNTLFQCADKTTTLNEVKRVLHHGGRLLLVDWSASFGNMGPTIENVFSEHDARALAESLNFTFEKSINAGNFHYGMVLRKGLYVQNSKSQR